MIIVNVIVLNTENYEQYTSTGLMVVDIKTNWCGPCKVIAPIIDELSSEYSGQVAFGKLDADENTEIVQQLGVRNIPTLLFYKDGEIVEKSTGAITKTKLKELIDNQLIPS
jgi:thioredoxin 1